MSQEATYYPDASHNVECLLGCFVVDVANPLRLQSNNGWSVLIPTTELLRRATSSFEGGY